MTSISLTIPMDSNALTHAAYMLNAIAADMLTGVTHGKLLDELLDEKVEKINQKIKSSQNAAVADVMKQTKVTTQKSDVKTPETAIPPPKSDVKPPETTIPPPKNDVKTPEGVELDSDGLPHDPRIHGSKKLKTTKDKKWKRIKNIEKNNPGLVEQVEAELRGALGVISKSNVADAVVEAFIEKDSTTIVKNPIDDVEYTVEDTNHIPAAPVDKLLNAVVEPIDKLLNAIVEDKYMIDGVEYTEPKLLEGGWTLQQMAPFKIEAVKIEAVNDSITFPLFMAKYNPAITAGEITTEQVTQVLEKVATENNCVLTSLPLLSARPDLVPAVYSALFS